LVFGGIGRWGSSRSCSGWTFALLKVGGKGLKKKACVLQALKEVGVFGNRETHKDKLI